MEVTFPKKSLVITPINDLISSFIFKISFCRLAVKILKSLGHLIIVNNSFFFYIVTLKSILGSNVKMTYYKETTFTLKHLFDKSLFEISILSHLLKQSDLFDWNKKLIKNISYFFTKNDF